MPGFYLSCPKTVSVSCHTTGDFSFLTPTDFQAVERKEALLEGQPEDQYDLAS